MKVSLASQALALEKCLDRSSLIARDQGMSRDAAGLLKEHIGAALETVRWLQANEPAIRAAVEMKRGAA